MNGSEEQFRKATLKQRDIDEIKRLGLPYLRAGMSHNAAAVELRRAVKRMEVRQNILKAWDEEKRARQQSQPPTIDTAEKAARAVLHALDQGGDQRERAERFLKTTAHPHIKQKVLELAGAGSEWKERRSNKTNGF